MAAYVIVMLVFSGITPLVALVALWRHVAAREFYRVGAVAMCPPLGAALGAGSWFATIPGLLVAFLAVMAWTEPSRRHRHEALRHALHALHQGDTPR